MTYKFFPAVVDEIEQALSILPEAKVSKGETSTTFKWAQEGIKIKVKDWEQYNDRTLATVVIEARIRTQMININAQTILKFVSVFAIIIQDYNGIIVEI